ncbi:MAG: hypothetical protein HY509_02690, partial [Acidobacteria bacterium]|nr:hypothetical protein [Acidobacteriota bacterium]
MSRIRDGRSGGRPNGPVRRSTRLLLLIALAGACGPPAPAPEDRAEFRRHLQQGLDEMRRRLFPAAAAEFLGCERVLPGDPDLRFHRARLDLVRQGGDRDRALRELEELAGSEPERIRAAAVLIEHFEASGSAAAAQRWRREVRNRYGAMGDLELEEARRLRGETEEDPATRRPVEEIRAALERGEASDADRFLAAIWRLGGFVLFYEPEPAAAELDGLFERYPDLSALRVRAGEHMRLTRYPRRGADPTRPSTSS